MAEDKKIYKISIDFESKHDWNDVREILEAWEMGLIAKIREGGEPVEHPIDIQYDGPDLPFCSRWSIVHDSRGVIR